MKRRNFLKLFAAAGVDPDRMLKTAAILAEAPAAQAPPVAAGAASLASLINAAGEAIDKFPLRPEKDVFHECFGYHSAPMTCDKVLAIVEEAIDGIYANAARQASCFKPLAPRKGEFMQVFAGLDKEREKLRSRQYVDSLRYAADLAHDLIERQDMTPEEKMRSFGEHTDFLDDLDTTKPPAEILAELGNRLTPLKSKLRGPLSPEDDLPLTEQECRFMENVLSCMLHHENYNRRMIGFYDAFHRNFESLAQAYEMTDDSVVGAYSLYDKSTIPSAGELLEKAINVARLQVQDNILKKPSFAVNLSPNAKIYAETCARLPEFVSRISLEKAAKYFPDSLAKPEAPEKSEASLKQESPKDKTSPKENPKELGEHTRRITKHAAVSFDDPTTPGKQHPGWEWP